MVTLYWKHRNNYLDYKLEGKPDKVNCSLENQIKLNYSSSHFSYTQQLTYVVYTY